MKEISVKAAFEKDYVIINLDAPVKNYEKYDFHKGSKCFIDNLPFQLMAENGELSFEAEAILLTAEPQKKEERIRLKSNQTISVLCIKNDKLTAYEFTIPSRIRHQSFIIK